MFRSNLSETEVKQIKEIAERRGMSPRGLRDYVLRELIRQEKELPTNRVAL